MKKGLSFYISSFAYPVWNRQKERPYDTQDRKIPLFLQAFFRRARKLIGGCHFAHFWRVVVCLANLKGRAGLSGMQAMFKDRRSRQAISDFLRKARGDAPEILRRQALDGLKQLGCPSRRYRLCGRRRHSATETGPANVCQ